jgi:predicted anti-sigma-YlaC factor YlaD
MTCRQFDDAILDAARGGHASPSLRAHLASCARCSASLQQQKSLTRGLRALAAADGGDPPADLEARLMDAFRQRVDVEPARPWRAVLGAAAAVLLVSASLVFAWRNFERVPNRYSVAEAEFVPWPGAASLPSFESGALVRTELPADVLPLLGIEFESSVGSETVMADVLIGQDGLARAVRLAR